MSMGRSFRYKEFSKELLWRTAEEVSSKKELAERLGCSVATLLPKLVKAGLVARSRDIHCSLATKQRMLNTLFLGEKLNSVESYLLGFYYGDGWLHDGVLNVMCANPDDFYILDRLEERLGVGKLVYSWERKGKPARGFAIPAEVTVRLAKKGLVFHAKSRTNPRINRKLFEKVEFFPFLRGIIDTDGCRLVKGTCQRLVLNMRWGYLVRALSEELRERCGIAVKQEVLLSRGFTEGRKVYWMRVGSEGCRTLVRQGLYSLESSLCLERKRFWDWKRPPRGTFQKILDSGKGASIEGKTQ